MVFSRYASVFREAGKIFRGQNFSNKRDSINGEIVIRRRAKSFHSCVAARHNENSSLTKNCPVETTIFHEKMIKPLQLKSEAATQFSKLPEARINDNDVFGENFYISNDEASLNYLDDDVKLPGALDTCDEDVSHLAPYNKPYFNLAAYANDSTTIQELAKLGVDLHRVEKRRGAMENILKYNFDDLKSHIQFLHDCGVMADNLGYFITKNPFIFTQDIDDMRTRIRYLRAHKFNVDMIARIVNKNPYWLMFDTKRIDNRLGHFQREYGLNGYNVRYLASKQPKLITYRMQRIRENTFAIKEEMGFDETETKTILLEKPRLFMKNRKRLVEIFDYVHNTMKLPHGIIVRQPNILTCRIEKIRQRHEYLELIGRIQYDPTKPMYVSPEALISGTDLDFCRNVAKTTLETYNMYLKTL